MPSPGATGRLQPLRLFSTLLIDTVRHASGAPVWNEYPNRVMRRERRLGEPWSPTRAIWSYTSCTLPGKFKSFRLSHGNRQTGTKGC